MPISERYKIVAERFYSPCHYFPLIKHIPNVAAINKPITAPNGVIYSIPYIKGRKAVTVAKPETFINAIFRPLLNLNHPIATKIKSTQVNIAVISGPKFAYPNGSKLK